jgi:membrane protease YdiL (CAAX protease family)
MLNPEIVKQEGNVSGLEWSISVPGSRERPIRITRSEHIVVKYWTLEGTETVLEETGSNARIIQQEIDNLNGILITDYASSFNITPPVLSAIAIVLIVLLLWTRTSLLDDTAKSVGIGRTSVLIGQVYRAPRKYGKYISGSPFVAFLYLMGIIVAEVYVCLLESTLGVVFCSVILVILIIHIQRASEYNTKKFLMSLLLVPISLLIVAFIPSIGHILDRSGNLTNLAIYGVILLAAAVAIIRIAKLAQQDLYLSLGKLRIQLLIGLTGAIIGPALYFLYRPEPLVTEGGWLIQSAALFFIIVAAAAEELVYRGILQSTSTHVLGRWGPIYISIAFAFIHLGNISGVNLSIVSIPFIFIVALFYSWAVGKTRSLLGVTLSHVICNVILWMVLAPM